MRAGSPTKHAVEPLTSDPRWNRIVARDRTADGAFWYSVATTGIYCRPSCPSRTANPGNVTIHDTLAAARASGCRPCKRCNPEGCSTDDENAALIEAAVRAIERAETPPALAELADAAGLSPSYFHRLFKTVTGVTPRQYASARRAARVRSDLLTSDTVTEAIYASGFGSNGRFYEQSDAMLGMTPSRYRAGGRHETLRFAVGQSSLGAILVASSDKGVAAILMADEPDALVRELQDRFPNAALIGGDAAYETLVARVVGMIEAPGCAFDLPLDVRGTRVSAARVERAASDSFGQHVELCRNRARNRRTEIDTRGCRRVRRQCVGRSRSPVTASCAPTGHCRAIDGVSSANACCSPAKPRRPEHDNRLGRGQDRPLIGTDGRCCRIWWMRRRAMQPRRSTVPARPSAAKL